MLDSRRDRRYRRGAHRSIGLGLRKVTLHNKPGISSGSPGFPLQFEPAKVESCESGSRKFAKSYEHHSFGGAPATRACYGSGLM